MNDIEELLQQYGIDRRQQQETAGRIMRMAQRRRRMMAAMACAAVLLFVTVLAVRHQAVQQPAERIIIARQSNTDIQPDIPQSDAPEATGRQQRATRLSVGEPSTMADLQKDYPEESSNPAYVDLLQEQQLDTVNPQNQDANQVMMPDPLQLQPVQSDWISDAYTNERVIEPMVSDSRWRFTASVGAFAMSQFGPGMDGDVHQNGLHGITDNNVSYTTITPLNLFTANMGVTYTVVKWERVSSQVGLIVSGQAQQGDIVAYDMVEFSGNGIDGHPYTYYQLVENENEVQSFHVFSLYAGIPLVIDMQPQGRDRTGWSFTLIPAHTLFPSQTLGSVRSDVFVPNPWKLTLGVGVTLPRRFPKKIGISTNLLPVSTSHSLHEIGVEVGF